MRRCFDCEGTGQRCAWRYGIPFLVACILCRGTGEIR